MQRLNVPDLVTTLICPVPRPEFGGVGAGLDLELADRVGRQADDERIEARVRVGGAVERYTLEFGRAPAIADRGVLSGPPVQRALSPDLGAVDAVRPRAPAARARGIAGR